MEQNRLEWLRKNQDEVHVDSYKGVHDVQNRAEREKATVERLVILPSSFIGSPRAMKRGYQDTMCICTKFGKLTYFITVTCKPTWVDIITSIPTYIQAFNRSDIIARVFYLTVKEIYKDMKEREVFGKVQAYLHIIEFQKRGLPHAHMLLMHDDDVPKTPEEIDNVICAEIPSPETSPRLHKNMIAYKIHGPKHDSTARCMEGGNCTKFFPKDFAVTVITSGFPVYRRIEGPKYKVNGVEGVDNQLVVPYNSYLTLKYNCHINVEFCASLNSVKYLFYYVQKGHDCATVKISTAHDGPEGRRELIWDEIETFLDTRIVTPPEAAWRLLRQPLYNRTHSICRLACNIPFEQQFSLFVEKKNWPEKFIEIEIRHLQLGLNSTKKTKLQDNIFIERFQPIIVLIQSQDSGN